MQLLSSVLLTQPQIAEGAGGGETDTMLVTLAKDILTRLPPPFNSEEIENKYPVMYSQSMNTVLRQVKCV